MARKTLIERAANDWDLADASAVKALNAGTADAVQQKRAVEWLLKKACALPDWAYQPGANDRDTNVALGRQFVGHLFMKLVRVDLSKVERHPLSDKPSEQG